MTSNSTIPLHEPVGTDTNNWTSLSKKEAKVRAKAVQKGHEPHDWRWAFNKVFKTNKAYPETLRPATEASGNVPSGSDHGTAPNAHAHRTTDAPLGSNRMGEHHNEGNFNNTHAPNAPLGSNLMGHQQRDGPLMAPENGPELVGGRDKASEPLVQTNLVG